MRSLIRKRIAAAAALTIGAVGLHAAAPHSYKVTIFEADFDESASQLIASTGTFFAFLTDQNSIQLASDGTNGNKLVIDDSYMPTGLPTAIACSFVDGQQIQDGTFEFESEFTLGKSDLPFELGIVIDAPQSDMIPATGPDGDGMLLVGGIATGQQAPTDVALLVHGSYSRSSPASDWTYDIDVIERDVAPGTRGFLAHGSGTIAESAGKPIVGIAFQKHSGTTGLVSIDDIKAEYTALTSVPKKGP